MEKRTLRSRKVSERMAVVDEADRRRVRVGLLPQPPPQLQLGSGPFPAFGSSRLNMG